jgi:hypothetical protein
MRLQIGAGETQLYAGRECDTPPLAVLAVGARCVARDFFARDPPTALDIERAIDAIEDAIMAAGIRAHAGAVLYGDRSLVDEIAALDGARGAALPVDSVERVFGRLAAIALGRPRSADGMPTDGEFAAALTILREVMHHGGFAAVIGADG